MTGSDTRSRTRVCEMSPLDHHTGRRRSIAVAVALTALALATAPVAAAPYTPTDDAQILERLPTAGNQHLRELRRLHGELAHRPQDLALALRIAAQDIEASRAESDPRYNGYAEAALAPWLALPNPPSAVLVLRATLRQATHDFTGALDDLNRVIAAEPRNAQARLTRAIVLQVEGSYADALKDCLSLARLTEDLVTMTCAAGINSLRGEAKAGREMLQAAIDRAVGGENAPIRLWALTSLAEIEVRMGSAASAERHFREALSLGLRDGYLLGAFADFLLDAGRPQEVVALLQNEARIDPLLLRLALAEQSLGAPALARHVADLGERFSMARQRGDSSHQREEGRFTLHLLHRAADALRLAEANWAVQHEPWDARLLLEAALAAGAPAAARPVLAWLAASQLEDERLRGTASRLAEAAR